MASKGRRVNFVNIVLFLLLGGFIYLCFNPEKYYKVKDQAVVYVEKGQIAYNSVVGDDSIQFPVDTLNQETIVIDLDLETIRSIVTKETKVDVDGYTWAKLKHEE